MQRYHELERRSAERLAELAREREIARREAALRALRPEGPSLRGRLAAALVALAARLDPAVVHRPTATPATA